MEVGDKVTRYPTTFENTEKNLAERKMRPLTGTVIYIHPQKRFHVVEFEVRGVKFRESFQGA